MSYSHQLQRIVSIIGAQATIKLIREKGGRYWSPPHVCSLSDYHWLVLLIGRKNAEAICDEFRAEEINLPIEVNAIVQLRNQSICDDYINGVSVSQIALNYDIHRKMVQKILDMFEARGKIIEQNPQIKMRI